MLYNGAQVVVSDQGMGTVIEVECSDCKREWPEIEPGTKVLIEGDREPICFPRDKVVLYSVFWLKNVNLGRLHICIGRNDDIRNRGPFGKWEKKNSFHFERLSGQVFISARIGVHFINIDWV